ncbi:TfoX/Sxy family protein [Hydrogenophaga sp. 5NK40-0174]|uniref:TfoX/Sxy family protein n=1 Tax=Hydrogenophaga sp. 5NK40-0174 TaxID=3127649 RepID=UPI00333FBDB6
MATRTAPRTDPFVEHARELLSGLGPCAAKRMFGGWSLSIDGMTLAVISRDVLYLKGNEDTETRWLAAGCQRFVYETKDNRVLSMNYYTAPEEAMESPALMLPWARLALEAAVAARAKPAARKRKTVANARTSTREKAPDKQAPPKKTTGKEKAAR